MDASGATMRWRRHSLRAKQRANKSFLIFIMFFIILCVIFLAHLVLLDTPHHNNVVRTHYEDQQLWAGSTDRLGAADAEAAAPALAARDAVWQPVAGTRFKFYVYSAFVERRTVAAIRVIAATKTRGPDAVFCRLWLPGNRTAITLKAKVQAIRENWNLRYSATYVLCLLSNSGIKPNETAGASVAIVASRAPSRPPTNLLTVINTEPLTGIESNVHVCVKSFFYKYDRVDWLIEWIEMNRRLGVSHFYMYNASVSEKVGCLLEDYINREIITLLPWKLPILSYTEIRTEGMFAAYNDCLYRSMSRAGWLLVIDTDELVLPQREDSLQALLASLDAVYSLPGRRQRPAAYLFRNAFFYVGWEDDKTAPAPLLTARKTRRLKTLHALKVRSKFAVRPRGAVELGNHFLWEHAPGGTSVGVPQERAFLHHYRLNCEYDGRTCLDLPSVVDRTAHKFSKQLWERVEAQQKRRKKLCRTNISENL